MKASAYRFCILLIATLTIAVAKAQYHTISGKVVSITTRENVPQAIVTLVNKDSSVIASAISDSVGDFLLRNVHNGRYIVHTSALSFGPIAKAIDVSGNIHDTIFLQPAFSELQAVTVTAKTPFVKIKQDTTEYNTARLVTTPDGTMADVFRQLPDLEISNGLVKAQGEQVQSIYVDGKPFLGSDLAAVMQAIPSNMIAKIQVIDKKSDQAILTGVDDGTYEKIINIVLKKNLDNGFFGSGGIGYGNDDRYAVHTNVNYIDGDRKLSVIAGSNNTGDGILGGSTGGTGIPLDHQLKVNFADRWDSRNDFSVWASFQDDRRLYDQTVSRQSFFSDSSTLLSSSHHTDCRSTAVAAGVYWLYRPDSATIVKVNESLYRVSTHTYAAQGFSLWSANGLKITDGNISLANTGNSPSLNGQVSIDRRLSDKGRNLFFSFSNSLNNPGMLAALQSNSNFYPVDSNFYAILLRQNTFSGNKNINIGTTVSYTEPLTEDQRINLSYSYNSDDNDMPKEVVEYNVADGLYDLADPFFSYHFVNNTKSNTASVSYTHKFNRSGVTAGIRWKQSATGSHPVDKDSIFEQTFSGFLPNFSFYTSSRKISFSLFYNAYVQSPQPYQLQPLIDNTNPLYLRLGNPGLEYAVVNNLRYIFRYYNPRKEQGFSSAASYAAISNNIGTKTTFDVLTGKETSQPINTGAGSNGSLRLSYYQPFYIGDHKLRWNVTFTGSSFRGMNILNEQEEVTKNTYGRLFLGLGYDMPEWLSIHTDIGVSRQSTSYMIEDAGYSSYYVLFHPIVIVRPVKALQLKLDYDFNEMTFAGGNVASNGLNAQLTKYFPGHKNIWITIEGHNLLNEAGKVSRVYADNYIEDAWTAGLSRFLLASVNINLNTLEK